MQKISRRIHVQVRMVLSSLFCSSLCFCSGGLCAGSAPSNPDSISEIVAGEQLSPIDITESKEAANDSVRDRIDFHMKKALAFRFAKQDKKSALKELEQSEQLYQEMSKSGDEKTFTLGLIAGCFDAVGDEAKSRLLFDDLAKKHESAKGKTEFSSDLLEMAEGATLVLDSVSVVLALYEEAYRQMSATERQGTQGLETLTQIGVWQLRSGNSEKALEFLNEAKLKLKQEPNSALALKIDEFLVRTMLGKKQFADTEKLCKERIAIEKSDGFKREETTQILALLADLYIQTGRGKEARKLFDEFKTEFKDRAALNIALLREFNELETKRNFDFSGDGFGLGNEATTKYEASAASKTLVNTLTAHYYVLKELGLYGKAKTCFEFETRLRRLDDKYARPRTLYGPPVPEEDAATIDKLSTEQKQKLERSNYEVNRNFEQYRKKLLQSESSAKLPELDEIIAAFKKQCS